MLHIAMFFWQLCLLKGSPRHLPASNFATGLVFMCYLAAALTFTILTLPDHTLPGIIGTAAVSIFIQAAATLLLLRFKGFPQRFRTTWTALLGANTVLLLFLIPFSYLLFNIEHGSLKIFADSVAWVLLGWWLAIAGYIYHKSARVSILQGSALTFVIELVSLLVTSNLFPVQQ